MRDLYFEIPMAGDDYYEILGVSRTANADEIKRAYRKLAKQYHPDRNPNDKAAEQKFKKAQEAYDILGNSEKRAQYDRFGKAGVGQFVDTGDQKYYTWGGGSTIDMNDLEDLFSAFGGGQQSGTRASIFDQLFGNRSRSKRPRTRNAAQPTVQRGRDIERRVSLSFEQSLRGSTVDIDRTVSGGKSETLSIKIPPGVEPNQRIRLQSKGAPSPNGGTPGDLFIVCEVTPHPYFRRVGPDIHLDVPISVTEALLGCKIDVPTLHGIVTVTVPPGTSSGAKLRLRGKGIENTRKSSGDQIVILKIVAHQNLTPEQKEIVEQLSNSLTDDPRQNLPWSQTENAK